MTDEIRFYLDENVTNAVASGLRNRKINVLTTAEAGNIGKTDEEQLSFAFTEHRVLVTHDDDFLVLANQGISHAGIAYCKIQTRTVKEILRGLILIYEVLTPSEMMNHIEFI